MLNFEFLYFFWNRDLIIYLYNVIIVCMEIGINKLYFEMDYWVWIVMFFGVLLMICILIYIVVYYGNKCKNVIVLLFKLFILRIFRWIKKKIDVLIILIIYW